MNISYSSSQSVKLKLNFFLDRVHETDGIPLSEDDSFESEKAPSNTLSMACGSVKNSPSTPIRFDDKKNTCTVGIVKPLLQAFIDSEEKDVHKDSDTATDSDNNDLNKSSNRDKDLEQLPADESLPKPEMENLKVDSDSNCKTLSNIVTPSRVASWNIAKQRAPSKQPANV